MQLAFGTFTLAKGCSGLMLPTLNAPPWALRNLILPWRWPELQYKVTVAYEVPSDLPHTPVGPMSVARALTVPDFCALRASQRVQCPRNAPDPSTQSLYTPQRHGRRLSGLICSRPVARMEHA